MARDRLPKLPEIRGIRGINARDCRRFERIAQPRDERVDKMGGNTNSVIGVALAVPSRRVSGLRASRWRRERRRGAAARSIRRIRATRRCRATLASRVRSPNQSSPW
jgi:hypothetical protein